jgi:hypothetical protein
MIFALSSQLGEDVTIFSKGKGSGYIKSDTREV